LEEKVSIASPELTLPPMSKWIGKFKKSNLTPEVNKYFLKISLVEIVKILFLKAHIY